MRTINVRTHGIMDYLMGLFLIASPWIFGFHANHTATWVSTGMGVLVIGYTLLTNFDAGAVGVIPFPVHLGLDVVGGFAFALSPWIFGSLSLHAWPRTFFILVGVGEIGWSLITKRAPVGPPGSLWHGAARRAEGPTPGHP